MFDENLLSLFIQIHINYFLSFMSCMIYINELIEDESISKYKFIELFIKSTYRPSALI